MTITRQISKVMNLQVNKYGGTLVFYIIQQVILSLGITIGFTYLYADIDKESLLYLSTGAPTMIFIMCGLACLPAQMASAKTEGHLTFLKTLPVNRLAIVIADTFIWMGVAIPGIVISAVCAHLIFRPGYVLSWGIVPAGLLTAVTCIAVGYAVACALKEEQIMLVCMICIFGSLMFSPVNYPMERLPVWLQYVHRVLPIDSMAQILRASLASTMFSADPIHYLKLAAWAILGFGMTGYLMNKR